MTTSTKKAPASKGAGRGKKAGAGKKASQEKGALKKSARVTDAVEGFGAGNWDAQGLLELFRKMLLIRRFEEKAGQLYGLGLIGGFCHLYIGQEAVVVGAEAARQFSGRGDASEKGGKKNKKEKGVGGDTLTTSYRAHGHALAVGGSAHAVMAELLGRESGCCGGKGGSMHLFDTAEGFYGGHGIVGAQVPIAAGVGFAEQYMGGTGVSIAFFGDGALNQGQVYESFNMAALWKLPVLFIIENNRYGMGTSIERAAAAAENLAERGAGYGIRGTKVDGMDVIAMHDAVATALQEIRAGGGPQILEAVTYRYRGHSMSDPAKYRSRKEVEEVRTRQDPIDRFAERLESAGVLGDGMRKEIDDAVRVEVNGATESAKADSEPAETALWSRVYAEQDSNCVVVGADGMRVAQG